MLSETQKGGLIKPYLRRQSSLPLNIVVLWMLMPQTYQRSLIYMMGGWIDPILTLQVFVLDLLTKYSFDTKWRRVLEDCS